MTEALSRRCRVTVTTSVPGLFEGTDIATVLIPRWSAGHAGRLAWTLGSLPSVCRSGFDALLCPLPEVPPRCPIPTIAVVHDLIPLVLPEIHSTRYRTFFGLTLKTLRWADRVACVSNHTRQDLLEHMPMLRNRSSVIYNGQHLEVAAGTSDVASGFGRYLLYVGGHPPHKNVGRLLEAFALLGQEVPDLKLVLVGWGTATQLDQTRSAIRSLGLTQRVELLPSVSDAELSHLYANCTAFVFPSLYEGFGLPVAEALAHGVPVICSRAASLPEIAGDAAVYFNPESTADLTDKLRSVLGSPKLADTLRRRGPAQAARFSWDRAAGEMLAIADALTNDGPGEPLGDRATANSSTRRGATLVRPSHRSSDCRSAAGGPITGRAGGYPPV
jgi:glycosyltransferase involved in cell wall biosynthesis